jgi:CDP-glucose 4,6-dehydratase
MEVLEMKPAFWRGRRVFVTGHTGFKGSWLATWLQSAGAEVHGYALAPPTQPNMYKVAGVDRCMASSTIADVRDAERLASVLREIRPEILFHLAAQPLVRASYLYPAETYATNVMGLVNLFEAVRQLDSVKALVNVTSDKCYATGRSHQAHGESATLGGDDPYSSSKACAELITQAYRASFLQDRRIATASARAGNVIGGGDWAADRLLPDVVRALEAGSVLHLRSPGAIRPWQHVLDALSGYLALAEQLYLQGPAFAEAWNFGPDASDVKAVAEIVGYVAGSNPSLTWTADSAARPVESIELRLDSSKSMARLDWRPRWDLLTAVDKTLQWHRDVREGKDGSETTRVQIAEYERASTRRSSPEPLHGTA